MDDLKSLSVFPATLEQIDVARRRTWPQWGKGLPEEEYLARDSLMEKYEHATDGKFIPWVLAPRNDPTTLEFKCSCETYKRAAIVAIGAETKEVFGYGVASVFTPPQNRRRGYARHMMRLMHWVIAPRASLPSFPEAWGQPPPEDAKAGDASFSMLSSDVRDFYGTCGPTPEEEGWTLRDSNSTTWSVPSSEPHNDKSLLGTWLDEKGAYGAWAKDVVLMRMDLQRSAALASSVPHFSFLPDNGVAAYMHRRAEMFLNSPATITIWGAVLPAADRDPDEGFTYATWTVDIRPPPAALIITRVRATPDTFPAILEHINEAARKANIGLVEVWNLPQKYEQIAAQALGAKTVARDTHESAFKWYGKEKSEGVKWMFNEKFCWC